MVDPELMDEMRFYGETGDYSDAERYELFALSLKLDKRAKDIGSVVLSLFSTRSHLSILETAASTGLTAKGVQDELESFFISSRYTNLDIEPNLLEYAKDRGRGDLFVVGDFESLPFGEGKFDAYIMMGATGYRKDVDQFYAEVKRVLKPEGYFIIPIIGPSPQLPDDELDAAKKAGLIVVRNAEKYFVARKS